jgi:hypothetical protein
MNGTDRKTELPRELMAHFSSGPWFDLSLEIGPTGGDAFRDATLLRLWTCHRVSGPWVGPRSNGPERPFGILKMANAGPRLMT